MAARKQWLAGRMRANGRLTVDAGAERVLLEGGKSLLPVGVVAVEGRFQRGDLVDCVSATSAKVIARGLVNYSSEEALRIAGQSSRSIETLLGYIDEPELIHRDNLALL
jgi:glutamate 5-kinase